MEYFEVGGRVLKSVFGCSGLKGIHECGDKLPSVSGVTADCVTDTGLESEC